MRILFIKDNGKIRKDMVSALPFGLVDSPVEIVLKDSGKTTNPMEKEFILRRREIGQKGNARMGIVMGTCFITM